MTVKVATRWPTNAEMILDVVELGYIKPTDRIIDLTFGGGKWWTKYHHPGLFIANVPDDDDLVFPAPRLIDGYVRWDYTNIPASMTVERSEWVVDKVADWFDVVVFDPPYVAMGGRATSTVPDFMRRYGLKHAPSTPAGLHEMNVLGLREAAKIVRPEGYVLVKCCDYVSSGKVQWGTHWMYEAALEIGFKVHDRLIHLGEPGPQPKERTRKCPACKGIGEVHSMGHISMCAKCNTTGRVPSPQVHARQNTSTLWIFQRPSRWRKP